MDRPSDIDTIEYFASPDDICRAFAGLQQLAAQPGLAPLGSILSANDGSIGLDPAQWPTVWFKGGSEPGVLTLGYLATNSKGQTFVVVAMLATRQRHCPRRPRPDCWQLPRAPSGWSGNPARASAAAREQHLSGALNDWSDRNRRYRLGRRGRAGRASSRQSPARGAPDTVPRSGAALIQIRLNSATQSG